MYKIKYQEFSFYYCISGMSNEIDAECEEKENLADLLNSGSSFPLIAISKYRGCQPNFI